MNKKLLITLFTVPLILTSCSGGEKKLAPGEKGDDVLTVEQKQELFAAEENDYEATVNYKEGSLYEFDSGEYTEVFTGNAPFHVYYKDYAAEKEEWIITSDLAGKIGTVQRQEGYETTSAFYAFKSYVTFGNTAGSVFIYRAKFETETKHDYYQVVVDQFGNKLYDSGKAFDEEEAFVAVDVKEVTKTINFAGDTTSEHLAYVKSRDIEKDIVNTVVYKYGENFQGLTKYEVPKGGAIDPYSYVKYTFTGDKDVKYVLEDQGFVYKISHQDKDDKTVTEYFTIPDGNGGRIGRYYYYQYRVQVNEHNEDYNYIANNGNFYSVHTYKVDLTNMEKEEVLDFPYILESDFNSNVFYLEARKQSSSEFPSAEYAIVTLAKLDENQMTTGYSEKYVVDDGLGLHDNITSYAGIYTKLGQNHYYKSYDNTVYIYDTNYQLVAKLDNCSLYTGNINEYKHHPSYLIVRRNGYYGVIDENGSFIVEPRYSLPGSSASKTRFGNCYIFVDGAERLYFNIFTMKTEVVIRDPERDYYNIEEQHLYVLRGKGELVDEVMVYEDDTFYYINQPLLKVDHFTGGVNVGIPYYARYNKTNITYFTYSYYNEDGNKVTFSVVTTQKVKA